MQGAYLAFLSSPFLPARRASTQPHAGTVSSHSPKPCAGSCLVSCQPLALASSNHPCPAVPVCGQCSPCLGVTVVQPEWFGCAPCSAWDCLHREMRVLCEACWQTRPAVHAGSLTHAVSGAVASGCRAAGRDCSAELLQRCQAAANPTQAVSVGDFRAEKDIGSWKPCFGGASCRPVPFLLG